MPSAAPQKIEELESLLVALQGELGVVVPDGKRNQLVQSLAPLMSNLQINSLSELAESLKKQDSDEIKSSVLDVMTRCNSGWSLSDESNTLLHKYIFAQLAENARIWVVDCGHGQLAYTVAMEIANFERVSSESKNIQIIASEIPMLDTAMAEAGLYNEYELTGLSDEFKRLFFSQSENNNWQVKDKIRQRVSFKECDLNKDFQSLGHMDLIICPDVLVYFSNNIKADVLSQFSSLLNPGGILLTEQNQVHAPANSGFERVDHPAGIFFRQKT